MSAAPPTRCSVSSSIFSTTFFVASAFVLYPSVEVFQFIHSFLLHDSVAHYLQDFPGWSTFHFIPSI